MTVRKLESGGDIATSGTQFIFDQSEIAQTIKTRLKLFLGEYFRDITDGTPWFQNILGKGQALNTREAEIKRRVAQTIGVITLSEFSLDFNQENRTYSISLGVITNFGVETISISDVF